MEKPAFQSTPDLVNRENKRSELKRVARQLFQSTPDLVNRENSPFGALSCKPNTFQSTPDLVNRENDAEGNDRVLTKIVSIHSRFS